MAKFIIDGQNPISGEIVVLGAKNAAIKMMAASILINGDVILNNVPDILDIEKLSSILSKMGAKIIREGHRLKINCQNISNANPDDNLVSSIRASVVLVGPILAKYGKARIIHPGGDKIGKRPIDRHIKAFQDLGIKVTEKENYYEFEKTNILNNKVRFDKISVTGTENILLFASFQKQSIIIENAAIEPEIIDLIEFLKKAGVQINFSDRQITVTGKKDLIGLTHTVIPDRIEAGTFMVLAAASKSNLKILNIVPEHLKEFLDKLTEIGVKFDIGRDFIYIEESRDLQAVDISTAEYPGLATDLQPPLGVLLTQATGTSHIKENIFENRLAYLNELKLMGANVKIINNQTAEISGPSNLVGKNIQSLDIRAGVTLIIAGLISSGQTVIYEAENIDRGYEKIEKRLINLGAKIKRVE